MIMIFVWTCDMTSRCYFGKMNSILGSVVPLAMFYFVKGPLISSLFASSWLFRKETAVKMWQDLQTHLKSCLPSSLTSISRPILSWMLMRVISSFTKMQNFDNVGYMILKACYSLIPYCHWCFVTGRTNQAQIRLMWYQKHGYAEKKKLHPTVANVFVLGERPELLLVFGLVFPESKKNRRWLRLMVVLCSILPEFDSVMQKKFLKIPVRRKISTWRIFRN